LNGGHKKVKASKPTSEFIMLSDTQKAFLEDFTWV
jgi:hypothetical protein